MGAATDLGSFAFFIAVWVPMMAAMMLPGAVPAVFSRFIRVNGRALTAPLFAGSYLAVWTLVGVAVYALYQPHGSSRRRHADDSGRRLRAHPAQARLSPTLLHERPLWIPLRALLRWLDIGLMVVLVALGIMSITWMSIIAGLILAQKLLPPRASIDVPVGLAIVGIGILIVIAPSSIPGLVPPM